MHWFWRATLGLLAAWVVGRVLAFVFLAIPWSGGSRMSFLSWAFMLSHGLELALAVGIYALLTRRYYQQHPVERETRCRQCRYILRGISEPRCPECGERI